MRSAGPRQRSAYRWVSFIGREIVRRLLAARRPVVALERRRDGATARDRMAAAVGSPPADAGLDVIETKDVIVTLKREAGQWKQGKNDFVLEFTSAKDKQPVDVGKVTLNTNMTMSGMAPMIAGATLKRDKTPGRYLGPIQFADTRTRQVTVAWDGPAGNRSTKFSVPIREAP